MSLQSCTQGSVLQGDHVGDGQMALSATSAILPFHTALDLSVLSCICITAASSVLSRDKVRARLHFLAGLTGLVQGLRPNPVASAEERGTALAHLGTSYSADSTSGYLQLS